MYHARVHFHLFLFTFHSIDFNMDTIWNEVDIKIPPLLTIKVQDDSFVKQVRSIILKRKSPQNDVLQSEFGNSAALLSRLMARRKNSFHNMNGFKFICKLNAALSRLLKVDVEHVLDNFFGTLPDVTEFHQEVPSRNSFDYVLVRIISVHKLYQRIIHCCIESADYFNKLLKNNFFMDTLTLFMAVIAKLWDLTNKLGNSYCSLYKKLVTLRKHFPQMGSKDNFENFNFPKKLDQFSIPNLNLIGVDSIAKSENTITLKHTAPTATVAVSLIPKIQKSEDIGMAISRDSFKPVIDLSRIHNIDDIRRYFKQEDEQRKKSLSTCATKHILKHEWLAIQKLVDRKIIANDHKKALSIFRKFITSKI